MSDLGITVNELHILLHQGTDVCVVDVRESWEVEVCQIEGSINIPLSRLEKEIDKISKNKLVVTVCHHGVRSLRALTILQQKEFDNVKSLTGGVDSWAQHIDTKMSRY